jgi:hypothetical protein
MEPINRGFGNVAETHVRNKRIVLTQSAVLMFKELMTLLLHLLGLSASLKSSYPNLIYLI